MSFLDRLFPGSHPHFEERHALLGQLETSEKSFNSKIRRLLVVERVGVRVSHYTLPQEMILVNRLTSGESEMRIDFTLTHKEKSHTPNFIKEVLSSIGSEPEDKVSVGLVFQDDIDEKDSEFLTHFGLILSPDPALQNRVGIALTSDPNLALFIIGSYNSGEKYKEVCEEFPVGINGNRDTRVLEILREATEWLPRVIEGRQVVGC